MRAVIISLFVLFGLFGSPAEAKAKRTPKPATTQVAPVKHSTVFDDSNVPAKTKEIGVTSEQFKKNHCPLRYRIPGHRKLVCDKIAAIKGEKYIFDSEGGFLQYIGVFECHIGERVERLEMKVWFP